MMTQKFFKYLLTLYSLWWILNGAFAETETETESEHDSESETNDGNYAPEIAFKVATSILIIITLLLVLSSFFEYLKDIVRDKTPEKMTEVVDVLFSEMTVLGFLSLVTFVIGKAGYLETLSETYFEELEEGETFLEELLESVHYDLFLVMVLYIVQTLTMICLGFRSEQEWIGYEKQITDGQLEVAKKELAELFHFPEEREYEGPKWWQFKKKNQVKELYRLFEFASLKKEFVHGRSVVPPFEIDPPKYHLPKSFSYATYLTHRLSKFMAEMIEMNVQTWLLLEIFLVIFYCIMAASEGNSKVLMACWLGLGYMIVASMFQLRQRAQWMREMNINPEDMPSHHNHFKSNAIVWHKARLNSVEIADDSLALDQSFRQTRSKSDSKSGSRIGDFFRRTGKNKGYESIQASTKPDTPRSLRSVQQWREMSHNTFFQREKEFSKDKDLGSLPGWCHFEAAPERGPFKEFFFGKGPNRQHLLFTFERKGPEYQLYAFRILMFMHAVYFAVLVLEFYDDAYQQYGLAGFFIYFAIGFLPTICFFVIALPAVKDTVHMRCIGTHKSQKEIARVIRTEKTKKALKTLILLKNLQNRLETGIDLEEDAESKVKNPKMIAKLRKQKEYMRKQMRARRSQPEEERLEKLKEEMGLLKFEEISKMFDTYDKDKGGEIDHTELQALMQSLGKHMDEVESKQMIGVLDIDDDGTVSKEEFMIWFMEQDKESKKDMDPETVASQIFSIFDKDKGGSIQISEFKTVLDMFKVDLDIDEITELARELDVDGDGTISEEEFANLLKRHKDEVLG